MCIYIYIYIYIYTHTRRSRAGAAAAAAGAGDGARSRDSWLATRPPFGATQVGFFWKTGQISLFLTQEDDLSFVACNIVRRPVVKCPYLRTSDPLAVARPIRASKNPREGNVALL